jgi:hypothetical protein
MDGVLVDMESGMNEWSLKFQNTFPTLRQPKNQDQATNTKTARHLKESTKDLSANNFERENFRFGDRNLI